MTEIGDWYFPRVFGLVGGYLQALRSESESDETVRLCLSKIIFLD